MSSPGCPILTRASDTIKIIRDFHPTCLPAFLRGQVVNRNTTNKTPQQRNVFVLSVSGTFRDPLEYFCLFARRKLSVIRAIQQSSNPYFFLCATLQLRKTRSQAGAEGGLVKQCTISAFLVSIIIKDHISIVLSSWIMLPCAFWKWVHNFDNPTRKSKDAV